MPTKYRKARITASLVDALTPGETVMDLEEPGFGVRRQGVARVFFVRKFARGVRHFETLGECGTGGLTVTTARDKAKRLVMALRDGHSPAEQRARERGMPTLTELSDEWLMYHVDAKLKSRTAADYRACLKTNVLPTLGRIRTDAIGHDHCARLHHALRSKPYAANKAMAVMSKMLNFAERRGYRAPGTNPVRGLERYREEKRERFLTREELAGLGRALQNPAIRERHSPFALSAIALLVLTGMRLREVLHLKWQEVDIERGVLFLSDSKTGKKAIILGQPGIVLLAGLARTASPYVFPGHNPERPMHDLRKSWASVTRAAALNNVRIHDLRHTFASYSAGAGGSLPMIGRLLGHSQPATTARYAHLATSPVRELADRVAGEIAEAFDHEFVTMSGQKR